MGRPIRYAGWGVVAAALALAGCSGGDDPPLSSGSPASPASSGSTAASVPSTTSGGLSTTSSPTTSGATPAAVEIPKAAQAHTPQGAEAFVNFYMEVVNRSWTKPDPRLLRPLSDPGCRSCAALQETAQGLADKGQRYVSNPVTVTRVAAIGGAPKSQQYVRLFFTQHKVNVVDSAGAVVLTDPAKKAARTAGVIWEGASWRMFDMAD